MKLDSSRRYPANLAADYRLFTVLDENNRKVPKATLYLGGHEYTADEDGTITVPFSTNPARQPIVLSGGGVCSLDHFQHQAESYTLEAGVCVDRESLLERQKAQLVVRPALSVCGTSVTLSVLEDMRLVIASTDHDGVSTTKEVADFELFEDRESVYEFQVPQRLASIGFTLHAKVQNLCQNKKIDLSAGRSFSLNEIDGTDKIEDLGSGHAMRAPLSFQYSGRVPFRGHVSLRQVLCSDPGGWPRSWIFLAKRDTLDRLLVRIRPRSSAVMTPSRLVVLFLSSAILAGGLGLTGCWDDTPRATIPPRTETFAEDLPTPSPDASYWPCFHGPNGDNISTDTGLLSEWPQGGPTLVWAAAGVGHGYSSVSLAHGRIYTDGNIEGENVITAMDLHGVVLWQTPNGPAWTNAGRYPSGRATPTVNDGRIYHESPLGNVVCLDAESGDRIWGLNILDAFEAENIGWALAESVLVDGDNLICCPGGKKASVVALDKNSGEVVWTTGSTGHKTSYATIAVIEHQGLRIILAMTAKSLIGVHAESGSLLFEYEHRTKHDIHATTPVFHDGRIFITSGYGSGSEMLRLTVQGDQATVERLWECKQLDNQHHGVVLLDGHIYGCAHGGKWICIDWQTGAVKYSQSGVGKGSITAAEGMLYTLSEKRRMGLVPATPDAHTVVSQFEVPCGGEGNSWAHPVVCGGRLYLRHSDKVYAYDIRAEATGE